MTTSPASLIDNDTICAISTPPGVGGIAVIRLSGPKAIEITDSIWQGSPLANAQSHTAHYGTIKSPDGSTLDTALATIMRSPRSFTGEDTVEISVHGSTYIQQTLIDTLINAGARLAYPGEFTRRAFASGKLDLAQAEAVADIIASQSRAEHSIAINQMRGGYSSRLKQLRQSLIDLAALLELELDFSEEEVEFADRNTLRTQATQLYDEISRLEQSFAQGNTIKRGIPIAIVGETNVGKSSLLNAIIGEQRAIVSNIHGTTRDIIEDTCTIGDYTIRFIDTAGIRHTSDTIEQMGIDRSRQAIAHASIIILLTDATAPAINPDIAQAIATRLANDPTTRLIIAINKTDLLTTTHHSPLTHISSLAASHNLSPAAILPISAATHSGIDTLRDTISHITSLTHSTTADIIITNSRHRQALSAALPPLRTVITALTPLGTPTTDSDQIPLNSTETYPITGNQTATQGPTEAYPITGDLIATQGPTETYPISGDLIATQGPTEAYPISGDLIAQDLREALYHIGTITGDITTDDLLSTIFSRFCIGK